jgi:signal transduction histidine kinase
MTTPTRRHTYAGEMSVLRNATRLPPVVVDGALATFFAVLAQVELHSRADDGYKAGPLWLNSPLEVLCTLPLLLRTTRPRLTLVLMGTAMAGPALFTAHTLLFWGNFLPLMLVNYTVARTQRDALGRWSWLVCTAIVMVYAVHLPDLRTWGSPFFPLVMFGATWGAGQLVRRLSEQRSALAAALAELQARQAEREDAAVDGERRRIAAEMHDVVAHAVSLMTLQVGAARMTLATSGHEVPPQLLAAEETGRAAVAELRRTLGVMRGARDPGVLEPVPDLAALPSLVPTFKDAGIDVDLSIEPIADLPASLQLATYRIVQESLTNVVKHVGPAHVDVVVAPDAADLLVVIRNAGRSGEPPETVAASGRHGLAGMRERVAMFGGSVDARPTADGGFVVQARLPIPAAVDSTQVPVAT